MTYDPKWRREDERRLEWLDKLYRLDGRLLVVLDVARLLDLSKEV